MDKNDNDESKEPKEEKKAKVKPYLGDKEPSKKNQGNYAKWSLLHGKSEEDLIAEGVKPRSVDIYAQELEKEGLRSRPPKPEKPSKDLAPVNGRTLQIFAKGSPPEALIEAITIPVEDGHIEGFEKGLKFGANMIILGVRVAQELSNLGVQQARPLIDMAKDMRSGEAAAARSAAAEAAMMTASHVEQTMMPYLASLQKPTGGEAEPMKAMMVRAMEPLLKNMMKKIMPGTETGPPSGWSITQE